MKKTHLALFSLTGLLSFSALSAIPVGASSMELETEMETETETEVKIPKNGWYEIDGCIYYNKNGKKLKGLNKIGTRYYYLDPETGQRITGTVTIEGKLYYFNTKNGARKRGFITYQGKTYYFCKKF